MSIFFAIVTAIIALLFRVPLLIIAALVSLILGSVGWAIGFVILHLIFRKRS